MSDFGKLIKILQYVCVVKAEFGNPATKPAWKNLGSEFSTVRMVTRFADGLSNIKFLVQKLHLMQQGKIEFKNESKLKWLMQLMDFGSAIYDNWYFLQKLNLVNPEGRALTD